MLPLGSGEAETGDEAAMAAFAKSWQRDSSKDWEVRFRANRTLSRHRRMTGRDPEQS
jgi:hypothetical protein